MTPRDVNELEPGYNRVPREVDLAVAEEDLRTLSAVEVD
jgi:hypothetical protein